MQLPKQNEAFIAFTFGNPVRADTELKSNTLIMFYKRRPIRDGRQIVEKNKRQGLAFSKKLRDSAHWGPEAVEAEFGLEAI